MSDIVLVPIPGSDIPKSTHSVSVVIPTHQRVELLGRTLGAVLRQTVPPDEVIVVVDGSTDETYDYLALCADSRIRVIAKPQACGVSAARNSGIEAATGRWVAFVDDDDLWDPRKLERQLAALDAMPEAQWCIAGEVTVDEHLIPTRMNVPSAVDHVGDRLMEGNIVPGGGSGVVADRELVRRVGGFDTELSMLADWDLWIRLGLNSPVAVAAEPLVLYMVHGANMSKDQRKAEREFALIAERYRSRAEESGIRHFGYMTMEWIARWQSRSGDRPVHTARMFLRLAIRQKRPSLVLRALLTVGGSPARRLGAWRDARRPLPAVDSEVVSRVHDVALYAALDDAVVQARLEDLWDEKAANS